MFDFAQIGALSLPVAALAMLVLAVVVGFFAALLLDLRRPIQPAPVWNLVPRPAPPVEVLERRRDSLAPAAPRPEGAVQPAEARNRVA